MRIRVVSREENNVEVLNSSFMPQIHAWPFRMAVLGDHIVPLARALVKHLAFRMAGLDVRILALALEWHHAFRKADLGGHILLLALALALAWHRVCRRVVRDDRILLLALALELVLA